MAKWSEAIDESTELAAAVRQAVSGTASDVRGEVMGKVEKIEEWLRRMRQSLRNDPDDVR